MRSLSSLALLLLLSACSSGSSSEEPPLSSAGRSGSGGAGQGGAAQGGAAQGGAGQGGAGQGGAGQGGAGQGGAGQAGAGNGGEAGQAGQAGEAGQAGSAGASLQECNDQGLNLCNNACVPSNDPAFGCGDSSCTPCPSGDFCSFGLCTSASTSDKNYPPLTKKDDPSLGLCGTLFATADPAFNLCLTTSCCAVFNACLDDGNCEGCATGSGKGVACEQDLKLKALVECASACLKPTCAPNCGTDEPCKEASECASQVCTAGSCVQERAVPGSQLRGWGEKWGRE